MTLLSHTERLKMASVALEGISIGDSFGQQFFASAEQIEAWLNSRTIPPAVWPFTDDTMMAASVYESLSRFGRIDQDALVESFCRHFEPNRGYGASMRRLLTQLDDPKEWRRAAASQFNGMGSHGNGAAMRVGPIGAYFFDDLNQVIAESIRSAEVTHTHPEGVSGAIAVGLASAFACRISKEAPIESSEFLREISNLLPQGKVRQRIEIAATLPEDASVQLASAILGNGIELSAIDTVPFSIWVAAKNLSRFEDSLWETVSALGDRDTTCAIVGGIVALAVGRKNLPTGWIESREVLPQWVNDHRFGVEVALPPTIGDDFNQPGSP